MVRPQAAGTVNLCTLAVRRANHPGCLQPSSNCTISGQLPAAKPRSFPPALPVVCARAHFPGRCGVRGITGARGPVCRHSGRKIPLAIARIPAVSRSPQPDPLFLLAGGPGQAAIETFLPYLSAFDRIRRDRDLVLVDQRGTGSSHALRCPRTGADGGLLDEEIDEARQSERIRSCLAQLDGDPRFYTTAATVADLDEVRQALGYGEVNLLGVSYGTRVALAYLDQYPARVRSLVLDGVSPLDWRLGPAAPLTAQRALDLIFARCSTDPGCHGAFPDLETEFQSILAALDREPVEVQLPDPQTGEPVRLR